MNSQTVCWTKSAQTGDALTQLAGISGVGEAHEASTLLSEGLAGDHGHALFVQQTVCEFTGVKASQAYVHKGVERALRLDQTQYRASGQTVQHDLALGAVFLAHGGHVILRASQCCHACVLRQGVHR